MPVFLQGFLIGVIIAAPLGPSGTFCATRIMANHRKDGLACALAISLADGVYSAFACLGLSLALAFVADHKFLLLLLSGTVLLGLGIRTAMNSSLHAVRNQGGGFWSTLGQVLLMSAVNPAAVLAFASFLAGFGMAVPTETNLVFQLVAGVMAGSFLWWTLVTEILLFVRNRLLLGQLAWINRIGGGIIALCGLSFLARGLFLQVF